MPFVDTPIGVTSTDQTKMYFQGLEERERKGYYELIRGWPSVRGKIGNGD